MISRQSSIHMFSSYHPSLCLFLPPTASLSLSLSLSLSHFPLSLSLFLLLLLLLSLSLSLSHTLSLSLCLSVSLFFSVSVSLSLSLFLSLQSSRYHISTSLTESLHSTFISIISLTKDIDGNSHLRQHWRRVGMTSKGMENQIDYTYKD